VVAILIDPNAETRPVPTRAAAPPPPPRTAVSWPDPPPEPAEPPAKPARRWAFEAGSGVVTEGAVAPSLVVGPRVFVGMWFEGTVPSTLDLSFARLWSGTIDESDVGPQFLGDDGSGSASMVLDVLRFDACVVQWTRGAFSLEPCLGLEAGILRVEGTHPAGPTSHRLFWGSAGAELRGSVSYRDVLRVSAEAGAGVPLVHYRFSFQGQPPLYETPWAGLFLALGLAVRFP